MRRDTILVRIGSVVGLGRYVDYVCLAVSHALPSVVDAGRYNYEARIIFTHIDLIEVTASR